MAKIENSIDFLTSIEKRDFESINTYIKESGDDSNLARWFASSFLECNDTTNWFAFLKNLVASEIKTEKKSVLFNLFARNAVRYFALKLDNYDETRLTELIRYITTLPFFQLSDRENLYKCLGNVDIDDHLSQELKSIITLNIDIEIQDESKNDSENQLLINNLKRICEEKDFIELFKFIEQIGMNRTISILEENPNLTWNGSSVEITDLLKNYTNFENLHSTEFSIISEKAKKFEMVSKKFFEYRKTLMAINHQHEFMNSLRSSSEIEMYIFFGSFYLTREKCKEDFEIIKDFFKNADVEIAKLKKMLEENSLQAYLIINSIKPFTLGLGKLGYKESLLTCAQVSNRKTPSNTYEFNPTIIYAWELKKYFEILKNCSFHSDRRERVIIVGVHWLTCDIQIKNDEISILVIEPLGTDVRHGTTNPVLKEIAEILPNTPIFFSKDKRQDIGRGCSVFALDDVMHLFTLEIYLPEKDLFKYFVNQNQQAKSIEVGPGVSVNIIPVELPLSLMRTTRSRTLINPGGIIDVRHSENKLLINKKGKTALESSFPFFKPKQNEPDVLINQRLEEKLVKIAYHNLTYLVDTPLEDVVQAMQKHTLAGFEQRLKGIQTQLEQQITHQKCSAEILNLTC